jgi:ribosomal protein S18 acetylase RimI-like enzyme
MFKYRVYKPKDKKKIKQLNQQSSVGQLADYAENKHPFKNIQKDYFAKGGRFWVVEDRNKAKIIGMIGLKKVNKKIGKMKSLRVHPDYRKQGIATKLVSILEKYAKQENLKKIVLGVGADKDSRPAVKLYKSLGYIFTHKKKKAPKAIALYFKKDL